MAGELVSYRRPDLATTAFNDMKLKLVIIAGGEMLNEIRRLAGPTISPGEEDFGMGSVEAKG